MNFCDAMEQWAKICNKYPTCTRCYLNECCAFCNFQDPYDFNPNDVSQLSDILEKEYKNAERN